MKVIRCLYLGRSHWGEVCGERVRLLKGPPFERLEYTGLTAALEDVSLLCPVKPGKVLAVALNDPEHIRETGKTPPQVPSIFMKPPSCLIGPGAPVIYPRDSQRVDPEAELAVVIGKTAWHISPREARAHIFGYTCANDMSDRSLQKISGQWCAAKGRDTFGPLGPWIETQPPQGPLTVQMLVNGQVRQSFTTQGLIFSPEEIVSFLSQIMTLNPGDVILTGTGGGIAPIGPGDVMTVSIQGIGALTNPVYAQR
ncbi:MAG: fumarylacetoacetate hydrolase family protein [Clostridia bacterium]|nr:fumarylacetoacetate hydrolase family protein [Clostridia bacterium]